MATFKIDEEFDDRERMVHKKGRNQGHPRRRLNHPLTGFRIATEAQIDRLLRLINIANGRGPRTNR